jgi:hypothetical protein
MGGFRHPDADAKLFGPVLGGEFPPVGDLCAIREIGA